MILGAASFDHFISAGEQRWRYRKAERLDGLEADNQLKSRRQFKGKAARRAAGRPARHKVKRPRSPAGPWAWATMLSLT